MNWRLIAAAAIVAVLGVQQYRIASLEADLAKAGQAASDERVAREQAAREHAEQMASLAARHAQSQQTLENTYAEKIAALEDRRRADARELAGLRGTIATYAASGRRPGETDAAALERATDRLNVLAGILAEGVELVVEGRGIVERRDAEVIRLLEQIKLDRRVCSPDPQAPSGS